MLLCPSCGRENPPDAKFCNTCGTALAAAPAARKERKFATALFADLVGSTSLAEREDPEVVQSVVGRTFDRLAQEIGRYEGLLEKFMGDAVLAVFGVPKSHEDDAERAVRAALEMQAILSELNRGFAAEGIYGQAIVVIPKERLVVAINSAWREADPDANWAALNAFVEGLRKAAGAERTS